MSKSVIYIIKLAPLYWPSDLPCHNRPEMPVERLATVPIDYKF